jgi:hypothetical protein
MFEVGLDTRKASFFDLYSRGAASADAIEDWVGHWHDRDDPDAVGRDLHAYLGLTLPEYQVWVHDADALPIILDARRSGRPLAGAVKAWLFSPDRPVDGTVTRGLMAWLEARA